MTTKHRYTFTILRYVHDVVTGEFINVGVVMHSAETGFVCAKVRSSIGRIKDVFPDFQRDAFLMAMRSIEKSIKTYQARSAKGDMLDRDLNARSISIQTLAIDDSSLQWSPIGGGISRNLEGTFERLYDRFVSRYDRKRRTMRSDDDIWRPVRQLLDTRHISIHFEERTVSGDADEISFKRAWKNGSWHAYEAISFDLADADGIKDKARRWRGHLDAVHEGIKEGLNLNFIVGAPNNPSLADAYTGAIKILETASFAPKIFEESEIPDLVDQIEDKVRHHLNA